MAFNILDHEAKLEPSKESGKYKCPACGGNNLSLDRNNGSYNCWNDPSPKHRAEIRNILAPMKRWERPPREAGNYRFPYENRDGERVLDVVRRDNDGKKQIFQEYPGVAADTKQRKQAIDSLRSQVLPYRYNEAVEASKALRLPVFVVEGELCCDAVWQIGLPSVTFLGGSKQYRSNGDYSSLFKNVRLVLCPDRDEPGVALMREVAVDNPGAQWLYADPESFEWDSLPQNNGFDISDWIDEGADQELILGSIVSQDRHEGHDGLPSYEEIIGALETMVGLYGNDARVLFEARQWMTNHGLKLVTSELEKLLAEAKTRVDGKEEIEVLDAKAIALSNEVRRWTIAGILPESSVMLLAAAPGSGKSTLIYNWALHVATGTQWSGRRCAKGKSLIIQCDEPVVDAAEKMQVIGYDRNDLNPQDIGFVERWRFSNIGWLADRIKRDRPQFVAIDSLTACLAGMDVDLIRSDAGNVIYELRDIANTYGCSIVILHHLNKTGGIRDSSSFEANVSEVVKLYRSENNPVPNEFLLEWTKSRSGLSGKHYLVREPGTYGWFYRGPMDGDPEGLMRVCNAVNNRGMERFDAHQVSTMLGMFDTGAARRMLEQGRRQGLISSSWKLGPTGERDRMYHSFDYVESELSDFAEEKPTIENAPEEVPDFDDGIPF
ncbi:RecA-family ATPase [Synechococcus phage S-CBS4]|uniref:RecA-family ATPase n=1 Tax=Synechococcus phage S-CBS4 TaxID=756275 RepID=UPI000246A72A|nr:RecA-family ATPase [Synechococcus phage S-CBS4]AEX56049.1 RecA-family ATPase [Synechococcus phage S-CBS4]